MTMTFRFINHHNLKKKQKAKSRLKREKKIEPGLTVQGYRGVKVNVRFFVIYEIIYLKERVSRTKGVVSIKK